MRPSLIFLFVIYIENIDIYILPSTSPQYICITILSIIINYFRQELSDTKNSLQTEKTSIEEMLKDVQRNEELATRDISNHKRNIKIHHNESQHDAALVIQKEWRQYISNVSMDNETIYL